MTIDDMEVGIRYVVVSSGAAEFKSGDHIYKDINQFLWCTEASGWLMPEELDQIDTSSGVVEKDIDFYKKCLKELEQKIKEIFANYT